MKGKVKSFRIKQRNLERLTQMRNELGLDNDNLTINAMIERWHTLYEEKIKEKERIKERMIKLGISAEELR